MNHVLRKICAPFLALLSLSAVSTAATRPDEAGTAAALAKAALNSDLAYDLVSSLTTEVGPRLAGSPGDAAAVAWAEAQLRRLPFDAVSTMEVIVPHWSRGTASATLLGSPDRPLAVVALGGSIGTPDEGVVAEVVDVGNLEQLAAQPPGSLAGKIAYIGERTERTRNGQGYGRAVRNRAAGPSAAAAAGASALVIRSVGTDNNRLAHTGALQYTITQPRIPAAAISNPDADLLERRLARGQGVRMKLMLTARDLPQSRSANVIADVKGRDSDEFVLIGAHLDSWDLGSGAIDDGAGVAIAVAAAKLIADLPVRPRRGIRVVLFANEEFGLSGANTYADKSADSLARHALAMEADFGAGPVYEVNSSVPGESWPMVQRIAQWLKPQGVALGKNETHGGADIGPLHRAGVPLLSMQLDGTNYFDIHHTANDTLDKIDPAALRQAVAAHAVALYIAANWPKPIGRIATEAEKAVR
ncbi:MAG: M20/M25/M40 family metallo-hydrolase [Steroidobacteraceae bacterium]